MKLCDLFDFFAIFVLKTLVPNERVALVGGGNMWQKTAEGWLLGGSWAALGCSGRLLGGAWGRLWLALGRLLGDSGRLLGGS